MKKITLYTTILLALIVFKQNANAQLIQVDYATRIMNSNYIFEGKVIKSTPYENAAGSYIYTSNTIEITKILKGHLICGTIEIITNDGQANDKVQQTSHTLHLAKGVMGVFACNLTNKEISAVDFYPENNLIKLEPSFEEQSLIQYYYNDSIIKAYDMFGVLDSLEQIYDLTRIITGLNYIDCDSAKKIICSKPINKKPVSKAISQKLNTSQRIAGIKATEEHKNEYSHVKAVMTAKTKKAHRNKNEKSIKTLTCTISNETVIGGNYEFDVDIADDIGGVYLEQLDLHLIYDDVMFGTWASDSGNVGFSTYPLISNSSVYTIGVGSTAPNILSLGVSVLGLSGYSPLSSSPTHAFHVIMAIVNCAGSGSVGFTDLTSTQLYTTYDTISAGLDAFNYDGINASQVVYAPSCTMHIYNITPAIINAGVYDTISIHGTGFGTSRGNGRVFFRNANSGGINEVVADSMDYGTWNDNLIKVAVMGTDSGYARDFNNNLNVWTDNQIAGTGVVKVQTNTFDTTTSAQVLNIRYAIDNFAFGNKKYQSNIYKNHDSTYLGYKFYADSMVWNTPKILGTVKRALHDWTCVTGIYWEVVGMSNPTSLSAQYDGVNRIQFGTFPTDTNIIAKATSTASNPCYGKSVIREIDVVINKNKALYIDTLASNKPAGYGDLYATLLHELGHAHRLRHVNDPGAIMYYVTYSNFEFGNQRIIFIGSDSSAIDGGTSVMDSSLVATYNSFCHFDPAHYLQENLCILPLRTSDIKPIENEFSIYPNPTFDYLNINFDAANQSESTISVSDIIGQALKEKKIKIEPGHSLIQIDVSSLSNGLYICTVNSENKKTTLKFIKQ